MFPRIRKITRLFFVALFVSALLCGFLNIGWFRPSSDSVEYNMEMPMIVIPDSDQTQPARPIFVASDMRHLHDALTVSQNLFGDASDVELFTRNVKRRLSKAGISAIREMQMAEKRMEVKPPVPAVNPHDFSYIHNPSQVCTQQPFLNFLVYIHSAPTNLKRRQIIRQTWGNPQLLSLFNASLIFALGATTDAKVQKMLDMEFEEYGDLLQEDYKDSYRNLTFKGISALKWAYRFCKQPLFFFKTDDDILLDIVSVINHVLMKIVPARGAKKLVLCNLWTSMKVIRDPKSKWGLSKQEFSHDVFPPYCSGSAFFLSGDMIPLMYNTALRSTFFWVDDYYISGMLVNQIGAKHEKFNPAYLLNALEAENKLVNDTRTVMVFHIKSFTIFFKAWHLLMRRHPGMLTFIHSFSTLNSSEIQRGFAKRLPSQLANVTVTALPPISTTPVVSKLKSQRTTVISANKTKEDRLSPGYSNHKKVILEGG